MYVFIKPVASGVETRIRVVFYFGAVHTNSNHLSNYSPFKRVVNTVRRINVFSTRSKNV